MSCRILDGDCSSFLAVEEVGTSSSIAVAQDV